MQAAANMFEPQYSTGTEVEKGKERDTYNAIDGFKPGERFTAYRGYIHDRLVNSNPTSIATQLGASMPKVAVFFAEQQYISQDNVSFLKSKASGLKKVLSYVIGSTVSGVVDALYNTAHAVKNLALLVFDLTAGVIIEGGKGGFEFLWADGNIESDFKGLFTHIKRNALASADNINQVVRNAMRAVPLVGHFLGEGFDKVELAVIDGIEVVASIAKSAYNHIFPPTPPIEQDWELVNSDNEIE